VFVFDRVRAQGSIVVAASGNESQRDVLTPVANPANCAGVIAVGALDATRNRAFYSNGGPELALVAPGGDVSQSTTGNGLPDGVYSTVADFQGAQRVPTYAPLMGTSMATPQAAGVIALMRWVDPAITPAQVATLIANGSLTDDMGAPGRDTSFGHGLISAKKAVDAAITSAGGNAPSGLVESSPSNLSFGSTRSSMEFLLRRVGSTQETVSTVTSARPGVTVARKAGETSPDNLGTYVVNVDRSTLGLAGTVGTVITQINVTTSSRTFTIALDVSNRPAGASGSFGPIYVIALDATGAQLETVAGTVVMTPVNGKYTFNMRVSQSIASPTRAPARISVAAGSDTDNDGLICNAGEACGAYPILGSNLTVIEPQSALVPNIDFSIAPFGGISPSTLALPNQAAGAQKGFSVRAAARASAP
jgi:serine protease